MRLEQGEHSILATFHSSTGARAAVQALREAGIEEVQLDRIRLDGGEMGGALSRADRMGSITGLTVFPAGGNLPVDDEAGVLLGADPAISGIGLDEYGVAGGEGFLVTVVTRGQRLNQALKILESHGGAV